MSDLISRCELFNRLATIPASPEANELKAQIYAVIQSMESESGMSVWCMKCANNGDCMIWDKPDCFEAREKMTDCQWMR